MSAALQLPMLWAAAAVVPQPLESQPLESQRKGPQSTLLASAAASIRKQQTRQVEGTEVEEKAEPATSWAFYRSHTQKLLRRYAYASLTVGRNPNMLADPVSRGWASSRRIKTFEDALIFVLDVERCLGKLDRMELEMIQRIVVQEYTQAEVAAMYRMGMRTVCTRLHRALDRLSEVLVESGVLVIPG